MGHVTLDDNRIQWFTESAMVIDYGMYVPEFLAKTKKI